MAESPLNDYKSPITFSIKSNGNEVQNIVDISISKAINKIPTASFSIIDGNKSSKKYTATNSDDYKPGAEVEISVGYRSQNQTLFKGIITSQSLSLGSGKGTTLEIKCKDSAVKMTVGRKNAFYSEMTDSDIISEIIGNHDLTADVDTTDYTHKELPQNNSLDWDFILLRAEANGLNVVVNPDKISVKKPDDSSTSLKLTYGVDIIDFQASLNGLTPTAKPKAVSWDSESQEISESTGEGSGDDSSSSVVSDVDITLSSTGAMEDDELKTWASATYERTNLSKITGSISFVGSSKINPGDYIELDGVSDSFNGNAFVSSISHKIAAGKWTTSAELGIEQGESFAEKPNIMAPPANGLVPGVSGLMVGTVKDFEEDPNKDYRVLVNLPLIMKEEDKGIWARLSTFYATNGKGVFFFPEVGDEVLLGFLNDDPRYPIILGSLYSSKRKAPNEPTADNFIKSIVSNSECKIEFDDENKVITLETPGNNKIEISDKDKGICLTDQNQNQIKTDDSGIIIKDKNNNKITMSSSGIEIQTNSDIKLKATGNIEITPTGNANIKATGDVSISGMGVSASANSTFKASGMASTEVSSTGNTTVKGSIVMIN